MYTNADVAIEGASGDKVGVVIYGGLTQTIPSEEPLTFPLKVPIWVLLAGSPEEILEGIVSAQERGSTHIKIKISQLTVPQAKRVLKQLDPSLHWRIDCNRAFTLDQALEIFSGTAGLPHLCIEEPLYDLDSLPRFPFPFALDETLEEFPEFPIHSYPKLSTLILKPTILGGKKGCQPLLEKAQSHGLNVIFTGAYESGIGTLQIVSFAQRIKGQVGAKFEIEPLGLGTYSFLEEDVLVPRLNVEGKELILENYPALYQQRAD